PGMAMAVPPARSSRRTQASAASGRRSLQATLAPYRDRASAMPLPMLGPVPVTSATLPARETSISPTTSFVASMLVRQRPMFDYDVVIIGGGPAGLTAGRELGLAGHRVLLLERELFGGNLQNVDAIEDAPAQRDGVTGAQLAAELAEQATASGLTLRQ